VCECNPHYTQTKIQKGQFLLPFFFFIRKSLVMKEWWRFRGLFYFIFYSF